MAKKFLKNLKSLFIIEEEETLPSKKSSQPSKTFPLKQKGTPSSIPANRIIKDESAKPPIIPAPKPKPKVPKIKINKEHLEHLLSAMEDTNLDGFDYLEFKDSLEALSKKVQMDEATRYKSAFTVASSVGLNVNKLTSSIMHYLKILQEEKNRFHENNLKEMKDKVIDRKKIVIKMEKGIRDKKARIEKLKKEIDLDQRKMIDELAEVSQEEDKVKAVEKDFDTAYNFLVGKIDRDLRNIRNYLTDKAIDDPFDDILNEGY